MLHIIRFEFKNLLASRMLWWLAGLLLVLIFFAVYNGRNRTTAQLASIEKVNALEAEFYSNQAVVLDSVEQGLIKAPTAWHKDPSNPLRLGAFRGAGSYAVLMPKPLAVVSTGQSDIEPFYTKVSVVSKNAGSDNANFENPFNVANGQFDLSFVLVFILPLLVIAFSYNILSSEREQGTLRLLLSMPLYLHRWLFAKLIFRILFVITTVWALLLIAFLFFGVAVANADIVGLLIVTALYILFWFSVAYFVNLLNYSSAVNALMLLGAWLLFVLIVPSVANMAATSIHPVPSRVEYVIAQRDSKLEAEKNKEKLLAAFYANNLQFERKADSERGWKENFRETFAANAYSDSLMQVVEDDYQSRLENQQAFANGFQFISPAVLMQNALNEIAGTGTADYKAFKQNVNSFHEEWSGYFMGKFYNDENLATTDFAKFPVYAQQVKPQSDMLLHVIALGAFSGLFLGLSFLLGNRPKTKESKVSDKKPKRQLAVAN
jgi:ABC-2 type transport system permease protein